MKLVIFDCDGTIVDSQNAIVAAMQYSFDAAGVPAPRRRAILSIVGLSLNEAFAALVPDVSPHERKLLIDNYRDAFRHMQKEIAHEEPMFAGARQTIRDLHARADVVLGVATGKSMRGVERLFEREELSQYFCTIQTADHHPSKPHPAMILRAMSETGATPETTIMIGDTSYDMQMAVSAGVAALGVDWGYHPADWLDEAGAHEIISSYGDLILHVDKLLDERPHVVPASGATKE